MAKHKGRAARKQQREKAAKATNHGLPAPALAPKPQKTRKVGGDTVAAAVASEKAGRTGPVRRDAPAPETGVPMAVKVLIGALVLLLGVYGLSQYRKAKGVAETSEGETVMDSPAQLPSDAPSVETPPAGNPAPPSSVPDLVEEEALSEDSRWQGEGQVVAAPVIPLSPPVTPPSSAVPAPATVKKTVTSSPAGLPAKTPATASPTSPAPSAAPATASSPPSTLAPVPAPAAAPVPAAPPSPPAAP